MLPQSNTRRKIKHCSITHEVFMIWALVTSPEKQKKQNKKIPFSVMPSFYQFLISLLHCSLFCENPFPNSLPDTLVLTFSFKVQLNSSSSRTLPLMRIPPNLHSLRRAGLRSISLLNSSPTRLYRLWGFAPVFHPVLPAPAALRGI